MTQTLEGVITTTLDICRNFPSEPKPKLPREHLIDAISKTLESNRIVVLEGEPLSGKSECLAELMRRSPKTSVGIFLNADLGVFYSPSYLRLVVAEQVSWILDGTPLPEEAVTEEQYRQYLFRLQRYSRHYPITWLVDGLVEDTRTPELISLLKLIPFGIKDFKFVVTAESDISNSLGLRHEKPKSVPVFPIGLEEAISFFSDLSISESVVHELRCFSNGNIGQMQKLRSFVRAGLSVDDLLRENKPTLESLFEFEWNSIPNTTQIHKTLAYVAFSNRPALIADISKFVGLPEADASMVIGNCRILTFSIDKKIVSIESSAQRTFIRSRLSAWETSVRSHVITTLLADPATPEATVYLPLELLNAGKHDELIKHLDPKHFLNLLATERSLHSIRYHASLGIEAAKVRENPTAELALSLIKSTATGLEFSIGFESQIEALIKLGSSEQALELASMAATSEERLHMLSIAANTLHQNEQLVPSELRVQIKALTADLSFEDLGDLGVEIACNLLPVDFDIATNIMGEVLDGARRRIDSARNEPTTDPLPSSLRDSRERESEIKRSLDLLPQDQARRFADAIASTVDHFSHDKIVQFIKALEPSNKITVLARWLGQNLEHPNAFSIAEQALDIVLGEVSRTPRLQDLREIAELLPYLKNTGDREILANKIETQITLLGHQGTSEDYIRLWLLIYRVRFDTEPTEVELSLIDLFGEIDSLKEVSIKVTCWTWMLFNLSKFKGLDRLMKDVPLISDVTDKLSVAIDILLNETANHFAVTKPAIVALARTNIGEAVRLIERLNTQSARDNGYSELVRNIQSSTLNVPNLEIIARCLTLIRDNTIRSDAICSLLASILRKMRKENLPDLHSAVGELWTHIKVAPGRLQALVMTSRIALNEAPLSIDLEAMTNEHIALWQQVLGDLVRIQIGYWVASEFASSQPVLAREWLSRSIEYEKSVNAASENINSALTCTLSLASRVVSYMDVREEEFSRIRSLIKEVREPEVQLRLWSRLGIRLHFAGKESVAKRIVTEHIEPMLNQSYPNNELVLDSMIANCAPLLYLVHPATATQAISRIGCEIQREGALVDICLVLLRRSPIGEPFDTRGTFEFPINQSTINDILSILRDIRTDSEIWGVVEELSASIGADCNKSSIPRTAALNYLTTLQELVKKKLPDKYNIKHDGYLIACNAYILRSRAKVSSGSVQKSEWRSLFQRARLIANVSDRVVVTAMVGSCAVTSKAGSEVTDWIKDIRTDLENIPSDQDRVDRHDWVAQIVGSADKAACRALVTDALNLIVQLPETDDILKRQRSLLDLANTLDPKLGEQLIALNDTDEARKERLKIERTRQQHQLTLARNPCADEVGKLTDHELASVCWDNLARLNAGRITPRSIREFHLFHARASKMSIESASAVWHFVIESSLRKRKSDKTPEFAQQLFDATCKASEVVFGLIGKVSTGTAQSKTLETGIIRNGDREEFIESVSAWARQQCDQIIRISDPYFGPDDIDLVKVIASSARNVKFRILTSKEHIKKKNISDVAEAFESTWLDISDDLIPETTIVVIGLGGSGKHPIHDRWLVSDIGGLRLGTSANSMGGLRTSEVSELSANEAASRRAEIDGYIFSPPREIHGERMSVAQYSL